MIVNFMDWAIWVSFGEGMAYQVEVQVISLEVCEGLIEGFFDVVWVVVSVPQLASDLEEISN